jgi:hypothetical protein
MRIGEIKNDMNVCFDSLELNGQRWLIAKSIHDVFVGAVDRIAPVFHEGTFGILYRILSYLGIHQVWTCCNWPFDYAFGFTVFIIIYYWGVLYLIKSPLQVAEPKESYSIIEMGLIHRSSGRISVWWCFGSGNLPFISNPKWIVMLDGCSSAGHAIVKEVQF